MRSTLNKDPRTARPWKCSVLFLAALLVSCLALQAGQYREYGEAVIITGENAGPVELNVARLLAERLREAGFSRVVATGEDKSAHLLRGRTEETSLPEKGARLLICLGIPAHHRLMNHLMTGGGMPPLTDMAPGPEGFLLAWAEDEGKKILLAAGIDERGCLYAAGELLRSLAVRAEGVSLADDLHVRTAPAFEIRGTQYGQSHVAKRLAKVREWTREETRRAILDYALAGANTFFVESKEEDIAFLRSFGLMSAGVYGPNVAPGISRPEWSASESIGRTGYLCPSVPGARDYLLKRCEEYFRSSPSVDLLMLKGGDGGGCECDRCRPYGLTFIRLCEEMAAIIHRYHPDTRLYFTNQKFDNEGDSAILAYLNEQPRKWLWAWGYGPGSDATSWQPGHRQNHRMDLFRYPGFGPYGLYPKELLHRLPARHPILFFNEITHWRYSQHGYIQMYPRADKDGNLPPHWSHELYERRPDQVLTMVYDRLTFFAWPRYYHRVFNDLLPYGIGDITHSSGNHDHFNQWMWQRLLWSPRQTAEEVAAAYCRTWFGPDAAPDMTRALFLMEDYLQEDPDTSIVNKQSIDQYYELVRRAGKVMAPRLMEKNWLWRMYMQKGAIDRYVKLEAARQAALLARVEERTDLIMDHADPRGDIREMLSWLNDPPEETALMARLKEEAGRLGEESNALYGSRSEGYFNLEHDFVGLGWLRRQLERALATAGTTERGELLERIVRYEDPGEGGFYDNLGTGNKAPHVVSGYPYDHGQPYVAGMLSEGNRPSQRSMHFTQDEEQGVSLRYTGLDPSASYRIRLTLVRPWYQERYAERMNQHTQSVYAGDVLIARDVELPLRMSDFFTFDIPPAAIRNGELVIRLKKAADVAAGDRVSVEQWRNSGGWGTLLSEAWLIKTVH